MLRCLALAICLLAPSVALADTASESPKLPGEDDQLYSCKSRTGEFAMTFKPEMEVKELLAWVMSFTCKQFVLDPRFVTSNRKVTIIAPNKMSAEEAYRMFMVALSTVGYTLVPKGNVIKVVESQAAKKETLPIYKHAVPDGEQVVRYVYRPTYAQAESLVPAWNALKSDAGDIQQIGALLLVTDFTSNVRDMLSLAKLVDVPKGSDGLYLLPVHYADAGKLADKLTNLLGVQAPAAVKDPKAPPAPATVAPSKILVDERTNTLIISASAAGYDRVKALVDRIDIPLEIEGGTTFHVYRLGSAVAVDLAKTLNEAIAGQQATKTQQPRPNAPPAPPPVADVPGTTAIEGQVKIIGDSPTNSLLVMSSGRDFLAIKDVIRQLDVPRRQVYIETVILDVSQGNDLTIGTAGHTGVPGTNGSMLLAGVEMPKLQSLDFTQLAATGLIGGLVGKELTGSSALFGKSIPSYALLFNAVANTSNTHIVSTPTIIGVDNAENKHKVGIDVPYSRGNTQGLSAAGTPFSQQSFDRKPLVAEMTITPHISSDNTVFLEVKYDAEDLAGESKDGQPLWSKRLIETKVVVRDQQTIVIGGMTQERDIVTNDKVPILGDIPLLGYLFKYRHSEKRRTNLLIMLTPYIIKDQMDLAAIQERKLREHHEFVGSFKTLEGARYNPRVDYTRKRGVVEEINRTLISIDDDIAARAALHELPHVQAGPIEVPQQPGPDPITRTLAPRGGGARRSRA